MKLVHPDIDFCLDLSHKESVVAVCAIESPIRWREIQKELFLQQQGEEGQWVLSKENKELKLSKAVEMISNPLQLDENQRRITSAFLKSFAEKAVNEMYWRKGQELNMAIQTFFCDMENEYSFGYHINPEIDFQALAKAMGFQIEAEYETDLERLLQYCILAKEVLHIQLFIFWNLRDYFSDKEISLFYDEIMNRDWNVLLMERHEHTKIDGEKWYVIDKDNCEIY